MRVAWIAVLVLAGWVVPCASAAKDVLAGVDEKWREYQSPNFELFSRNSDRESRELLREFELLRAVFADRLQLTERARVPVSVYFFRSVEDFHAYSPEMYGKSEFFRGFYTARPDRAFIMVAPIEDWEHGQWLIFHEYIHHLFRVMEQEPTTWFNEGMADLLATIREAGDVIEVGRPHTGRLLTLQHARLIPLETLFAVDHTSALYHSEEHTGLFYAESWALLHYLYFGQSGLPKEQVHRFLSVAGDRRAAAKVDLRALFRECFGLDYPAMLQRLEEYVVTGRYGWSRQPMPKIADAKTYAAKPLSRDEARLRLAEVALRVNRSPAGKLVLLEATEKTPTDSRPFEALGGDALSDHDTAKAQERWEQAIAAGSRNPALYRELALMESHDWFRQFDYYFKLPAETADRLRQRLQQSIALEPEQTAAYEMLAWVEAFAPQPAIANVNTVQQRFPSLRQKARTLIALAMVRVRTGKPDEALSLLADLDKLPADPVSTAAAQSIRAKLTGAAASPGGARSRSAKPPRPPSITPKVRVAPLAPPPIEVPEKR